MITIILSGEFEPGHEENEEGNREKCVFVCMWGGWVDPRQGALDRQRL